MCFCLTVHTQLQNFNLSCTRPHKGRLKQQNSSGMIDLFGAAQAAVVLSARSARPDFWHDLPLGYV